jgi:LPXTG-site transpeptidase (sortase) family protein
MGTGRSRLSTVLAATGALLVIGGLVALGLRSPTSGAPDASGTPGADPTASVAAAASPTPQAVVAEREPGAPRKLLIPALGVAAPVVPVEAPNDTLVPPADADQLGWWADGAMPGAERGSALVAGHTVHTGGGALQDLEQVQRGERVVVRTDLGRVVYEVDQVHIYSKGRIARHAEQMFSQEVPGRLVLVTCEDWDGSRYLSNVVVVATPVGA